jgi:hypothetical protein
MRKVVPYFFDTMPDLFGVVFRRVAKCFNEFPCANVSHAWHPRRRFCTRPYHAPPLRAGFAFVSNRLIKHAFFNASVFTFRFISLVICGIFIAFAFAFFFIFFVTSRDLGVCQKVCVNDGGR